jgi:hypothetical protein
MVDLTIEQRLARLERQNRRLRCAVTLTLVAIPAAALTGMQEQSPATQAAAVDSTEFRLLDKQGKPRARLAMLEEGPALLLTDAQGNSKAKFMLDDVSGPSLSLCDHNAFNRISLAVKPTGATLALADGNGADRLELASCESDATVSLYDHRHKSRARLGLDGEEQPSLHFYTTDGLPLLAMLTSERGPSIALCDNEGHHLWCMPKGSQEEPAGVVAETSANPGE